MLYGAFVGMSDLHDRDLSLKGWTPGVPLAGDIRTHVEVEAQTWEEALEKVWEVGNRMGSDHPGRTWSSDVRSVSIGDVVVLVLPETSEFRAFAVRSLGWEEVRYVDVRDVYQDGCLVKLNAARSDRRQGALA
jgi:hypothetical protein